MSIEDLMNPRYKVIAEYPGGIYKVGDFVQPHAYYGFDIFPYPEKYPHLFQPLQWWEEREEKDMPEYVKEEGGKIHKVKYYEQYNELWMESFDGNTKSTWCVNDRTMSFFEPAPESEYNDYVTNKQNS